MFERKTIIMTIVMYSLVLVPRLLFSLLSNNLFSTDIWPLFRSAQILLKYSPCIFDDTYFDGYNNHWPMVIISSSIMSEVSGFTLRTTFMYVMTFAANTGLFLAVIIFLKRLTNSYVKSLTSSALALLLPSIVVFTASPLKEVYALPIAVTIFSLLLKKEISSREIITTSILFTCLLLAHHLALFMLSGFIISIWILTHFYRLPRLYRRLNIRVLFYIGLIFLGIGLSYFYLNMPGGGAFVFINMSLIVKYVLYSIFIYGLLLFFLRRNTVSIDKLKIVTYLIIMLFLLFFADRILPGVYIADVNLLPYITPPLLLIPMILYVGDHFYKLLSYSILIFIILNTVYVTIGEPGLSSITHRFANYIFIPITIASSYLLISKKLYQQLIPIFLILSLICTSITIYNITITHNDVSFFWYYPRAETLSYDSLYKMISRDVKIIGDTKIRYYFDMLKEVDSIDLIKMNVMNQKPDNNSLIIIYRDNLFVGYEIGLSIFKWPPPDTSIYSRIYDSSIVYGYMRLGK